MRISTAVLVLLSIVATPLASIECMTRCERFLVQRHPICHGTTQVSMGPHMHHMNDVHMVNQDREADAATVHEQPDYLAVSLGCRTKVCANASEAVPSRKAVRSARLEISSYLPAVTFGSLPMSFQNPSKKSRYPLDTDPYCRSTLLRI